MSDKSVEMPSFELPPQPEIGQVESEATLEAPVRTPEAGSNQPGIQQQPVAAPQPSPVLLQTVQAPQAPTNIIVQSQTSDDGLTAADTDLIEKMWVDKAKDIVAKTADDPHTQKEEISKVKAEYLQKRFKKSIKTDHAEVVKQPYEATARPVSPSLPAPVNQPDQAG